MSLSNDQITTLYEWTSANSFCIDARICIRNGSAIGVAVYSASDYIPPYATLVKIPKAGVLSVRTCSLAKFIPVVPYGLGAQLSLSLALYVELLKQHQSSWHGYLQSLPSGLVDIPIFWGLHTDARDYSDNEDRSEALAWLNGTEAVKLISSGFNNLDAITRFYLEVAEPLLLDHAHVWRSSNTSDENPNLLGFYRAFSLVSSRAFLVDAYHGLSMVPIADAFNHAAENHVHLESDYNVCPECGALYECPHDRDEGDNTQEPSIPQTPDDHDHDCFYEMVSNTAIPPHSEIFNTYGETLTNAELLNQYGFVLDVNDNDRLFWTLQEITKIVAPEMTQVEITQLGSTFQGIYEPVSKLCREFVSCSELVYEETAVGARFCLNDEGQVSLQLWALLLTICWGGAAAEIVSHHKFVAFQELHLALESLASQEDSEEGESHLQMPENCDLPMYTILLDMFRFVVLLCISRKKTSGKAASWSCNLSDIMEEIPEERHRTRLALSVLLSERSILDSCEARWTALAVCGSAIVGGSK